MKNITDPTIAAKAAKVASIPNFFWIDVVAKVPLLATYLAGASSGNKLLQIVVYDLPDRDCAALASNGEFSIANNGLANYEVFLLYIDCVQGFTDVTELH